MAAGQSLVGEVGVFVLEKGASGRREGLKRSFCVLSNDYSVAMLLRVVFAVLGRLRRLSDGGLAVEQAAKLGEVHPA